MSISLFHIKTLECLIQFWWIQGKMFNRRWKSADQLLSSYHKNPFSKWGIEFTELYIVLICNKREDPTFLSFGGTQIHSALLFKISYVKYSFNNRKAKSIIRLCWKEKRKLNWSDTRRQWRSCMMDKGWTEHSERRTGWTEQSRSVAKVRMRPDWSLWINWFIPRRPDQKPV